VTISAENGAPFTTLASTGIRKFRLVVTLSFITVAMPSCHATLNPGETSCAETRPDANDTDARIAEQTTMFLLLI